MAYESQDISRWVGEKIGAQQVPPPPTVCRGFLYRVRAGETLASIAQRFGVSVNAILAANPQIVDPNQIFVNQLICIPVGVPPPPPPPPCPDGRLYTVQPGDTLFSIAQRFGVTVADILAANPQIVDPNVLEVGQVICIPVPAPPPPPPAAPCCLVLRRPAGVARGEGVAWVQQGPGRMIRLIVSIGDVPEPSQFGNFNQYVAAITARVGRIVFPLRRVPGQPFSVWTGAFMSETAGPLQAGSDIIVFPTDPEASVQGPIVLRGSIAACR